MSRMRRTGPRPRTITPREIRHEVRFGCPSLVEEKRPQTRGDCLALERPCPWVSCKFHLYLDVNPETGSIKINFPGRELDELPETCSLDVADAGGVVLEELGVLMNLTRERVRQIEDRALAALRQRAAVLALDSRAA